MNRLFFYLLAYFVYNGYDQYRDYRNRQVSNMELQLLETSFNLDEGQNLMNLVKSMEPDGEEIEVDMSKMVFLNKYIEERAK